MRLSVVGFINVIWLLWQTVDPVTVWNIAEKYGFPSAFLIVVFFVFMRQIKAEREDRNAYRDRMEKAQEDQVNFLRRILAETQKANALVCKFEREKHG